MKYNVDAARKLVDTYNSITLDRLKSTDSYLRPLNTSMLILRHLTSYGSPRCVLCVEAKRIGTNDGREMCFCCIYGKDGHKNACGTQASYLDIHRAQGLDDLLKAIHARADYIQQLLAEKFSAMAVLI